MFEMASKRKTLLLRTNFLSRATLLITNSDLDRYVEVTPQQTPASGRQLDDQNYSNAANDSFHSVGEEPSLRHQKHVLPNNHETT